MIKYLMNLYIAKEIYNASIPKLKEDDRMIKMFQHFGYSKQFMKIAGTVEALGATFLVLSIFSKKFTQLGALLINMIMAGAMFSHLKSGDGLEATKPAAKLFGLNATAFMSTLKDK